MFLSKERSVSHTGPGVTKMRSTSFYSLNFFEKSSASARFLMVCHSQGTVHVMNALLDYPPELRKRITVVAVAPGGYIYQEACAQVIHYRNASKLRDYVPYIDKKGAARSKETIIDLTSHPDAGWFDHNFQSLTYQSYIRDNLTKFINE